MNRYMDGWILVQHPNPQHIFYTQPGSDRLPEGGNITVNILKKKTTAQRSRMGEQRETVEGRRGGKERNLGRTLETIQNCYCCKIELKLVFKLSSDLFY